ncbi:hypothetical protein FH972_026264 [Carpinus fangiana]|uniref:Non-homologous end-joining factor 1 n=1 Tax=Carpinus fangiana TaxID=176857 RepID=A0A5N6L3G3_9ROSI|nr:hypothetical protein FH972_026264 [Carpinus fangiana]
MYSPWALLPAASSSCSLLFRHDFTANSYAIQITNLQVVWAESLDRRRIIGRALDENTAIDPSEDSTQLRLLLDHIRGAFSKDNSRLQVQDLSQSELRLHATSPLPSPLKDLKWSFRLSTTAKQSVATELAAPLMSLAYFQTQQLQQLTESLKQKDVAISKILEKIEAAGFELAAIFPTIASNKKGRNLLSRDQVLQQMQGLKPFDAKTSRTSDVETPRQPLRDMLDVALAGTSAANVQALSESLTAHFLTSSRPSKQLEKVTDGDEDVTMDETAQLSLLATTESGHTGEQSGGGGGSRGCDQGGAGA